MYEERNGPTYASNRRLRGLHSDESVARIMADITSTVERSRQDRREIVTHVEGAVMALVAATEAYMVRQLGLPEYLVEPSLTALQTLTQERLTGLKQPLNILTHERLVELGERFRNANCDGLKMGFDLPYAPEAPPKHKDADDGEKRKMPQVRVGTHVWKQDILPRERLETLRDMFRGDDFDQPCVPKAAPKPEPTQEQRYAALFSEMVNPTPEPVVVLAQEDAWVRLPSHDCGGEQCWQHTVTQELKYV